MILFADSFDHYSAWFDKYDFTTFGNTSPTAVGRFGTNGYNTFVERGIAKNLSGNYSTLIAGMAIAISNESTSIFSLYDGASPQVSFFATGGQVNAYRGLAGTLLGTTSGSYTQSLSVYHYWEFKVTIDDTAGVIVVRRDGDEVLSLSGIDTANTANEYANRFWLGSPSNTSAQMRYDDFYLLDDTDSGVSGAPNDDFLGDIRVDCLYPNGNGNSSQWDGSDGNQVDNYLLVDETPYDDDTTYVMSADIGDKDTYAMTNLASALGTVYGMQVIPRARKTDAGTKAICSVVRSSAVEEDSADKFLSTGYTYLPDIREADPSGNQWTVTTVNAMEVGQKVTV